MPVRKGKKARPTQVHTPKNKKKEKKEVNFDEWFWSLTDDKQEKK